MNRFENKFEKRFEKRFENRLDLDTSWFSSTSAKSEVAALPLQPEEPDSDIAALERQQAIKTLKGKVASNSNVAKTESEQQLENLLSNLLKYGVLIASAVVLFGGIVYLANHGLEPARYSFFHGEPEELRSPVGIVKDVSNGSSRGIIQLGLLLLVAIPVIRVIISLFTFLKLRDFTYALISLLVLTGLVYSLAVAY